MWQDDYLLEIRKIDRDQSPHGLYGMREALSTGKWLLPVADLLGGEVPQTDVARRLGWPAGKPWSGNVTFTAPISESVSLRIETHASTKVRHYGNSYVLDKVHGKKVAEGPERVESAAPKLAKAARKQGNLATQCLLFIAHVPLPDRFDHLLGKGTSHSFLDRYGLKFHSLTWPDIYDRDFHTGLFLWSCSPAAG